MSENNWWHMRREDETRYNLNNRVMLVALISLFFVVVIVVLLHIYARCILRHQARRRAIIHRLTVGAQAHTHEPPKHGIDPSVLAALPIFVYKTSEEPNDPGVECSICLTALEEEEMARLLPNCKHTFHAECIDMWLHSNSTCPVCRSGVEPKAPNENGEQAVGAVAPQLDSGLEGAADVLRQSPKEGGSGSRLSSFRRMLSRERSDRRLQADVVEDLERQ
ncbi:E3 ubiquitin-protein ligase ATL41-like protein [Cinnamomum micranthum f. kanehirae]|uniref:RING-type E3 ubiquitin transferase n=1 Tax=Cinnamomum micranthum f. kanehirae TaxID=337451 RepID=A0A3S3PRP2_9MAGN|nr:E3 ubiquitin-protein ligase ATL41-like protein [Cinnamomum micranthum f. kanehirae]